MFKARRKDEQFFADFIPVKRFRQKMININDQLSFNRILLLAVGLWPNQKSKLVQFYSICCFSILVTFVIFQLTTFMTSKCTINLVIQVLSSTSVFGSAIIIYYSFYSNIETVKYLLEQLQRICDTIKDKNEIAIIERYANHGKRYTILLTTSLICTILFIMGVQLWPTFRDIILSANVTRPQIWNLENEYFIDEEKYFYLLFLHINVGLIIVLLTMTATGLLLIAYFHYVCAMFQIASYRIEHAMQIYIVQGVILLNENMMYKKIVCAVDIHRKAIMFSEQIMSTFQMLFMIILMFIVFILSLNFYCVLQVASLGYTDDFLMPFLLAFGCILYFFIVNFVAQQVIDENEHIFVTTYRIQWYVAPIHIQKLILFLLERGNKPYGLCIGKLFVGSLQCFSMICNTSVSYCTVMYSMGL